MPVELVVTDAIFTPVDKLFHVLDSVPGQPAELHYRQLAGLHQFVNRSPANIQKSADFLYINQHRFHRILL